ncbi:YozE family protein [Limosilactobacillus fastidiosus]|uniref:YozE SAM-like domain-containing protein n=1 Tax=Limosilactobacillus fastidiosus TaxID=2759855 RepID=A0ABR6E8U5_9LACO|nr:YozE family protein [Limosilactobacillus fastidiosus]MBB1063613.1 hypothetical protein [Limosilactobacillus fastidiosus]MCD7084189.1 YozE family protein [Limosilactobacillus fastidiosus]
MNFNSWIKQFLDEDSQYGDLARDIERDKSFPINVTTWNQIENHFPNDVVTDVAKSTFEDFEASL